MTQQGSINRDLETLARSAALSLGVPFVTIAVNGDAQQDAPVTADAVFADAEWAAAHRDLDLVGLDNASAVAQNLPFYACVPVRNDSGDAVGRVCCGGSEERGLTDAEIGMLKSAAAEVAALLHGKSAPAFARA
jgi:GAF domain-containing protein